jgi:tRNA(Ile)-lysidine synthase
VEAFLAERGIPWREDPTNHDGTNLRSRLRHEVLPALVRENPELLRVVGRTAAQMADVEDLLDAETAAAEAALEVPGAPGEFSLDGPLGRTYHRIVLSCLLRKAARRLGQGETAGFDPLDRCVSAWKRAERLVVDVPGGVRIRVEPERVSVTRIGAPGPRSREREVPVPGRVLWSEAETATSRGAVHLTVEPAEPPSDPRGASGPWRAWIDADSVVRPLRVRGRRPGDRYRPLGLRGSVKIQDLYVDGKVPRTWRDALPLVVDGRGILWVPGFRVDQRSRITDKTRTALRLEITGHLPRVRESTG